MLKPATFEIRDVFCRGISRASSGLFPPNTVETKGADRMNRTWGRTFSQNLLHFPLGRTMISTLALNFKRIIKRKWTMPTNYGSILNSGGLCIHTEWLTSKTWEDPYRKEWNSCWLMSGSGDAFTYQLYENE